MSLPLAIERQMSALPDSVAVAYEGRTLTYCQLKAATARVASGLAREGVKAGNLVAVFLHRSPEMLAALLGIWQAGAAYLPLDASHPAERIAFMLEDSGVSFIISETSLLASIPQGGGRVLNLDFLATGMEERHLPAFSPPGGEALAYVIYTSGSTGRPKGARVSHAGLANTIHAIQSEMQLQPRDVMLAGHSIAFDVAGLELYLPLISGARVHMVNRDVVSDGPRLMQVLRDARITVMSGMVSTYRLLFEAGWQGDPNLQLTVGGEAIPLELAQLVAKRSRALWNHYGPTETSICATSERIDANTTKITLGRQLANVQIYILDRDLRPLPSGSRGEIYIGGEGVGLGYLNRPELTAASFLPDPFSSRPGARIYKTGDLGALLPDGRLEFLGRADEQVKIRGFRIELEEVERALCDWPEMKAAVVRAIEFSPDDKRLIAFILSDEAVDPNRLRSWLRQRLPDYMVPAEYIRLDSFPLSTTGKIDRLALDALRLQAVGSSLPDPTPNNLEDGLKRIWQRLFRIAEVRPSDNFFDLGGHSLLAARMLAQVEKQFSARVSVSVLVEHPTIEKLAKYIRQREQWGSSCLVKIQSGGSQKPLFITHGVGGSLLTFRELAAELGGDQPVFGLRLPASMEELGAPAAERDLIKRLAAKYVEEIRTVDPHGPYQLAGHSSGGLIVFEIAKQLEMLGCEVRLLVLLDSDEHARTVKVSGQRLAAFRAFLSKAALASKFGVRELVRRRVNNQKLKIQLRFVRLCKALGCGFRSPFFVESYFALALLDYSPGVYRGDTVLFVAENELRSHLDPALGWRPIILGNMEILSIPGGHQTIFDQPYVQILAKHLADRLHPNRNPVESTVGAPPAWQRAETTMNSISCIGVEG